LCIKKVKKCFRVKKRRRSIRKEMMKEIDLR